jgi:hypothetical protein
MYATLIFSTFLTIFILTAVTALADLVGLIKVRDEAARKWLRTGLLAEVIAVILAMASMLLLQNNSEAWTIFGKIVLNEKLDNASPQQAIISIAPPTVEIDESGKFTADIVMRKRDDGSWDYPKIQITVQGYASKTIHFDDIWTGVGGETNQIQFKRLEDKRRIVLTTPIVLEALDKPYSPPSTPVMMLAPESAPSLDGNPL